MGYIDFLSTPSLTVEDCRVKQELANRITALLTTEESRLGSGESSHQSSEQSVRSSILTGVSHNVQAVSTCSDKEGSTRLVDSKSVSSSDRSSVTHNSKLSNWRLSRTRSEELYNKGEMGSLPGEEDMAEVLRRRVAHMKKI